MFGILFWSLERNTEPCYGSYGCEVDYYFLWDCDCGHEIIFGDCSVFYSDTSKEIPNSVTVVTAVRLVIIFCGIVIVALYILCFGYNFGYLLNILKFCPVTFVLFLCCEYDDLLIIFEYMFEVIYPDCDNAEYRECDIHYGFLFFGYALSIYWVQKIRVGEWSISLYIFS